MVDTGVAFLRHHTLALHSELDQQPALRRLLNPKITRMQHDDVLVRLAGLFSWLDRSLVQGEAGTSLRKFDPPYQVRGAWLPERTAQPTCDQWELTRAAYWGARYVVEGSSQGSRLILRRLEMAKMPLDRAQLTYWRRQVAEGQNWAAFCAALNHNLTGKVHHDEALEAARHVFQSFIDAFGARDSVELTIRGVR